MRLQLHFEMHLDPVGSKMQKPELGAMGDRQREM
jgi:hypothetical protein